MQREVSRGLDPRTVRFGRDTKHFTMAGPWTAMAGS